MPESDLDEQSRLVKRSFDHPDSVRPSGRGQARVVELPPFGLIQVTLPPGWRWSLDVRPSVRTALCESGRTFHVVSGRLGVKLQDGSTELFGPGDVGSVPPGHDAWTEGDEPVVYIDLAILD